MENEDNVVCSSYPDIEAPKQDIYGLISSGFSRYAGRVAIIDGVTGREYTYKEIDESICKFSTSLQRMGFARGDCLCIVLPNMPEYPVIVLGVLRSGGVVSPCNPAYKASELAFQFKDAGAKVIVTFPGCISAVQEAAAEANVDKIIVIDTNDPQSSSGNLISFQSMLKECGSILGAISTDPDDAVLLPYSSGTTGLPKGVMLTNHSVASNLLQMVHPEIFALQENPNSCMLGLLPCFHIYGLAVIVFTSLFNGIRIVSLPKFEPEMFLSAIEKYKVTLAPLVPPLILFLAKHPLVDKYDLSSLEQITSGAAPLGGDLVKAVNDRIKCKIIRQGYGLTETSPVTHLVPLSLGIQYPSSIGKCVRSTKTKIVDPETNKALPANSEGEVWISGPQIMKGYLNNPEATRNCITEDGWFKTGDIGYYDEQGLFYITDRLKELIKVKGFQVAPAELEALLLTHPKIADAAVIGVPNERLGEAPKAFIVKKDESLTEKEVEECISQKLAKHKHLTGGVEFIAAIPKSASGKILHRLLRK